jgi:hypothetical protein
MSDTTTTLPSRHAFLSGLRPISVSKMSDSSTGNDTCTICLGDLADVVKAGESERAVLLHGKHFFGEKCIRRWLEENDNCPNCRKKVHTGSDDLEHRRFANLDAELGLVLQRTPTTQSPMIDFRIFSLFGRMARAIVSVTSDFLRDELRSRTQILLGWRAEWWRRNLAFLTLLDFAPYTRAEWLRVEDLNARIVVDEDQVLRLLIHSIDRGYVRGLGNYLGGEALHVGAHPVSFRLDRAVRRQLRKDQGKRMTVSALAVRFRDALEHERHTEGLMNGEREDLPRDFRGFCEDVIIRIVRGLIGRQ